MPEEKTKTEREPYRVRLPGFVSDEQIGLGDIFKRVTSNFGVTRCGGCESRTVALNRWFAFTGRAK